MPSETNELRALWHLQVQGFIHYSDGYQGSQEHYVNLTAESHGRKQKHQLRLVAFTLGLLANSEKAPPTGCRLKVDQTRE